MSETTFLAAIGLVSGTVAFIASLRFLRRYLELRHERRIPIAMDGLHERLERIETAVETTALEVERSAEANRFMAKLLADRVGAVIPAIPAIPAMPASRAERVITPH